MIDEEKARKVAEIRRLVDQVGYCFGLDGTCSRVHAVLDEADQPSTWHRAARFWLVLVEVICLVLVSPFLLLLRR